MNMDSIRLTPLTRRRLQRFRSNRRGWWSLWIFVILFIATLLAEVIANDKPFVVYFKGEVYFPIVKAYPETTFGGDFLTEADYRNPYLSELIEHDGWALWPIVRYHHRTVAWDLPVPAPAPPDRNHWLGTDDQARDVLARVIYGFRISVLFGFALTFISAIIGVSAGAVQGYFGGWLDLVFQRFIEIWSGLPTLYLLPVLSNPISGGSWVYYCCSHGWASLEWCEQSFCAPGISSTYVPLRHWVSVTLPSCFATCCPMPWSPRSPLFRSRWPARSPS